MLTYTLLIPSNSTGQLCSVDQLYSIQNSTGTVSASNILSFVTQVITGGLPILGVQQSLTCNNCTKEAYNIFISNVPQAITSSDNSSISSQCGANFTGSLTFYLSLVSLVSIVNRVPITDRNTPGGISQTASGNSLPDTKNNGALQSFALWDGLTILSGLGILLTILL
jgi:hypothetical protein